jgi:CPA2 family monovalent cation:H+ antiporter-2
LVDFLVLENTAYVALDSDPDRVQAGKDEGHRVELGDATKLASLMSAGLVRAAAVAVTYPETASALKVLAWVKEHAPHVPVIVRTHDDRDLEVLRTAGAAEVVPEVIEGSLMLASQTLAHIGIPLKRVIRLVQGQRMTRYALMRDALKHKEGLGDSQAH